MQEFATVRVTYAHWAQYTGMSLLRFHYLVTCTMATTKSPVHVAGKCQCTRKTGDASMPAQRC